MRGRHGKSENFAHGLVVMLAALLATILMIGAAGCGAVSQTAPTPLPTVVLDQGEQAPQPTSVSATVLPATGGSVIASGIVAPAQQAVLVFPLNGQIQKLAVEVGDEVSAGEILAQIEGEEDLLAAVSEAEYELLQAEQALEDLKKAAVNDRVMAMKEIITYERLVRDAQYALDNFTAPSNQVNMDTVEALQKMKEQLDIARKAFEPHKYSPSTDQTREDAKEVLDEAQADYNAAVKRLQYEYDLEVAEAELTESQRDYATLKEGPDPDKVKLAERRVDNARTQVAAAQAALNRLKLTAPFDGTISQVDSHTGEWVTAGQPVVRLADLENLRVETTDLSERDVPNIQIGQAVDVFIKALGVRVPGRIAEVAPTADMLGGDVVYRTTIELESIPTGLRAGMSVEATFLN